MANVKISQLTELTTLADADTTIFVDASEATVESTKKVTLATLQDAILNHATTLDFEIAGTAQLDLTDGVLAPTTDNDIVLGSGIKQFATAYFKSPIAINGITQGADITVPIHRKKIDIGDWNMDALEQTQVAHGLTLSKIVNVSGTITDDAGTYRYILVGYYPTAPVYILAVDASYVYLKRQIGGAFDQTSYDSTGYNRGYIIVEYLD